MNSTKHILIALVGHSPQIITESIYAYKKQHNIDISEVKVVTTAQNRQSTWQSLNEPRANGKSILACLANDLDMPPIKFTVEDVLIPKDEHNKEIEDVQSEAEMKSVAKFLLELVKEHTSNKALTLHASLAGGRKTMTFYMSYAMTLYARPQDTLSHVFVSSPYESNDFFYPTPYSQIIMTRDGARDTKDAKVSLAKIPFVQIRPNLPLKFLEKTISFEESESLYDILNSPLLLEIDIAQKTITCSGVCIELTPANFAFYLVMVDDLLNSKEGFDSPTDKCPDKTLALVYLNKRYEVEGHKSDFTVLEDAINFAESELFSFKQPEIDGLKKGLSKTFFNGRKNQISKQLRNELPEIVAEHYDIDSLEKTARKGSTKLANYFGINIEPRFVRYKKDANNEVESSVECLNF